MSRSCLVTAAHHLQLGTARPMTSILLFGLLAGLRHALDADHLAAVASLSARGEGAAATIRRGGVWGLGHAATLLGVAVAYWWADVSVPLRLSAWFEAGVGVMLFVLGADVLRRMRRGRVHVHLHRHGHGVAHVHAHRHRNGESHDAEAHRHPHPSPVPARAFLVGMVHGAAGSGALVLLAVQAVASPWAGVLYVALFGVGSIAGMMIASAAIVLPMRRSAALVNRALPLYELGVGAATVAIGLWVLYDSGMRL